MLNVRNPEHSSPYRTKKYMGNTQQEKRRISIHHDMDDEPMTMEALYLAEKLFAKLAVRTHLSTDQQSASNKSFDSELVHSKRSG